MESTPPTMQAVAPASVAAAFAQVPDPRRAASVVSPLPAILALAVAAILANHLSVLAIAEWGARQDATLRATLGFPQGRTPCQSTLQRLFRQLDADQWGPVIADVRRAAAAFAATKRVRNVRFGAGQLHAHQRDQLQADRSVRPEPDST